MLRDDIDILSRLSGDEFAVLLKGTSLEDAYEIAQRIYRDFEENPLTIGSHSFNVNSSIGVSSARMVRDYEELKKLADYALIYSSKEKKQLREPTVSIYSSRDSLEERL